MIPVGTRGVSNGYASIYLIGARQHIQGPRWCCSMVASDLSKLSLTGGVLDYCCGRSNMKLPDGNGGMKDQIQHLSKYSVLKNSARLLDVCCAIVLEMAAYQGGHVSTHSTRVAYKNTLSQ